MARQSWAWRIGFVLSLGACFAAAGASVFFDDIARTNLSNADFDRTHEHVPWELDLPHENVTVPSRGIDLAGWWIPGRDTAGQPAPTVLLVHGHSSERGDALARWSIDLWSLGYHQLLIDLPNHGSSPDRAGGDVGYGASEWQDVVAASRWIRGEGADRGADPDRIVWWGGSMGATTVLLAAHHAAPDDAPAAVVADSGYASFSFQALEDGREDGYPDWLIQYVVHRMGALSRAGDPGDADAKAIIGGLGVPVFLAHCENDRRVGFASFERLAAAAPQATTWSAECLETDISSTAHVTGYASPSYWSAMQRFLLDSLDIEIRFEEVGTE